MAKNYKNMTLEECMQELKSYSGANFNRIVAIMNVAIYMVEQLPTVIGDKDFDLVDSFKYIAAFENLDFYDIENYWILLQTCLYKKAGVVEFGYYPLFEEDDI